MFYFFASNITQCVYSSKTEGGRRGKKFTENYKEKHTIDAMYGWYRYESRFALPVFNEVGEMLLYTGRLVYNHSVN